MTRYVALLRAVNVAGHARVEMPRVRAMFVRAGCRNVQTYIQSGNVVFDTDAEAPAGLFERIRAGLCTLIGEEPCIVFRTARQVQALVKAAPFGALASDPQLKLYAVCLATKPRAVPPFPWEQPKERLEAIGIKGLDVLIVSRRKPTGFYGFPNAFVEQMLGVQATSRNWSTVRKIADLLEVEPSKGSVAR